MNRVRLEEVSERGSSNLAQKDIEGLTGNYPIYGASGYIGTVDFYHQEKDYIAVVKDGAGIGRTMFLPAKSSVIGTLQYIIPNERVLPKYLYYAVKHMNLARYYTGATIPHIYYKDYKNEMFWLSDMPKQQEVVLILEKVEKIIQERQQELLALDNLLKSRFLEMFGHQSSNENGLPYGTIADVAEIYLGITHTPKYVDEGIKFISAKNISGDFLDLSDVKYISKEEFEGAPLGAKPKKNDVLFSRVGSNLGHPVILDIDEKLCTFVSLGYLRPRNNMTSNYLKHWMRDDFFSQQVKEHVKGGGQPNLNTGWLKDFKIIVPKIDAQIEFEKFANQVDKSKSTVQKALTKTQLLFDSLMQQYFG